MGVSIDLVAIAKSDGMPAMVAAAEKLAAETDPKKQAKVLAEAGLGKVSITLAPADGAEVQIGSTGTFGNCVWGATGIECHALVYAQNLKSAEFVVRCDGALLTSTPDPLAEPGRFAWTVPNAADCLRRAPKVVEIIPIPPPATLAPVVAAPTAPEAAPAVTPTPAP